MFTTNVDGPNDSQVPLGVSVKLDGVNVWYFPCPGLRRLYWSPALARALKRQIASFDVVHLHSVFLWPTWAAARAARRARVPYLVAPRGMMVKDLIRQKSRWLKTVWIRLIERYNLEKAAGIHVTALLEKEELLNFGFHLPTVFAISNGVDLDEMTPDAKPVVENPYILYLGRINWKKGLDKLVKAMMQIEEIQLIIAGNDEEAYQPELEQLVTGLGLAGRVQFIGPVSGPAKWRLFQDAKIFVLPSRSENFGIAVLEAMAMGCPVLISPDVGLAEVVQEYECGMVVNAEPAEIAKAVHSMLGAPERLRVMGERGRALARSKYSWAGVATEMEQAYFQISSEQAEAHEGRAA